jgi:hypothetical protein
MEKKFKKKGVISVIAFLTLGILTLLSIYFLSFTLIESRISKSQETATKTYYLAEAGINAAIWKLKNDAITTDGDDAWEICFVTSTAPCVDCTTWSDTIVIDTGFLIPNSTTTVTIQNSQCARGEIIATSTIALPDGKTTQRVVKTTVFKSLASPTSDSAIVSGGASENIDLNYSKLRVYGSFFSNHNFNIKGESTVEVNPTGPAEGKILAVGIYNESADSTVSSTAICAKNICNSTSTCGCTDVDKFEKCEINSCPPKPISTPIVDFDSDSENSFKSRAQIAEDTGQCQHLCNDTTCLCNGNPCPERNKCVLTDNEFENLLWAAGEGGTLALNSTSIPGVVYVEGAIELRGSKHLIVNGSLVADDNITIGERNSWVKGGEKHEGPSQITINRPTATTTSGLLTKRKINFGQYSSFENVSIVGVIYANDEIKLTSVPNTIDITGGIVSRKLSLISIWQWLNINLDNDIILYGLGYIINGKGVDPEYSPIITIEHWEESY